MLKNQSILVTVYRFHLLLVIHKSIL